MSALVRQLVLRKRAAETEAKANAERYARLLAEAKGEDGRIPAHEWDGTRLRFENPDGTWGEWVDLRGRKGEKGDKGADGVSFVGGGGARFNPAALDPLPGAAQATDYLVLEREGVAYRVSIAQLQDILGGGGLPANVATVNGAPLTVDGAYVTVTT